MLKNRLRQILQWGLAMAAGFAVVNACCFLYERPVGWLDTSNGASTSVWRPGAVLVHGTEGYGISVVDENGYLNPSGELADRYVLMMGSSHTQGKEVRPGEKYSARVNDWFSDGSGKLVAYNIASDGHFLPTQLQHFPAAVAAYPNAGAITIEIGSTDFSGQELHSRLRQAVYAPGDTAQQFEAMGTVGRLKTAAKESLPLLNLLKQNLETMRAQSEGGAMPMAAEQYEYETELNTALGLLRSSYDGPIAFVYHPSTVIEPDGTLLLEYSRSWDSFCKLCEKNQIDVIDVGPRFREAYENTHRLPYGFANTIPGEGHLNALGHQIVAQEIISYLEELRA